MELAILEEAGLRDQRMLEYGTLSLKRCRSPPKSSAPSSRGTSSPKSSSTSAEQVSSPIPCMVGNLGGKGSSQGAQSQHTLVIFSTAPAGGKGITGEKRRDFKRVGGKVGVLGVRREVEGNQEFRENQGIQGKAGDSGDPRNQGKVGVLGEGRGALLLIPCPKGRADSL